MEANTQTGQIKQWKLQKSDGITYLINERGEVVAPIQAYTTDILRAINASLASKSPVPVLAKCVHSPNEDCPCEWCDAWRKAKEKTDLLDSLLMECQDCQRKTLWLEARLRKVHTGFCGYCQGTLFPIRLSVHSGMKTSRDSL